MFCPKCVGKFDCDIHHVYHLDRARIAVHQSGTHRSGDAAITVQSSLNARRYTRDGLEDDYSEESYP